MSTERRWLRRQDGTYWVASTDDMHDHMVKNGFVPCSEAEALAAEGPTPTPAAAQASDSTSASGKK